MNERTLDRVLGQPYTQRSWSPDGTHLVMLEEIEAATGLNVAKRRIVSGGVQPSLTGDR
jgi:hypothetical protein